MDYYAIKYLKNGEYKTKICKSYSEFSYLFNKYESNGKIFKNFATKLLAVALGGVIYFIVLQIVIWFGVDTNLLKLFQALVVAIFLAVPYWKGRYFNKPKKIGETAKEDE